MKVQINILLETIKKNCFWFILLLMLIFCKTLSISFALKSQEIEEQFLNLISMPKKFSILNMYQLVFTVYIIYRFYTYEFKNSFENIVLRANDKKWLLSKVLTIGMIILLIKIVCFYVSYLFFYKEIKFNINYIFIPFLYYYAISLVVVSITNLLKKKQILIFIMSIIFTYLIFMCFGSEIMIILLISIIIFNFSIFKFKRLLNES